MQRLRLELSEALLTPTIRAQGLGRCWFCPSSAAVTIADFTREIHAYLRLDCAAELRLVLSGFTLPTDGPVGLLRDGDLIAVQKVARPATRTLQLQSVAQTEGVAAAQGGGANVAHANTAAGGSSGGGGGSGRKRKRRTAAVAAVDGTVAGSGGAGDAPPQNGTNKADDLEQGQEGGQEQAQGQEHHVQKARRIAVVTDLAVDAAVNTTPGAAAGRATGGADPDACRGKEMFVCGENEDAEATGLSQRTDELDATPRTGTDGAGAAAGEKKRASRSARRKAYKRRLCRQGVLPYKGAGRGTGDGGTAPREKVSAGRKENLVTSQRMGSKEAQGQKQKQQKQLPEKQHVQQPIQPPPLRQQQEGPTSAILAAALAASPLDPNGTLPGAAGLNSNYAFYAAANGAVENGSGAAAATAGTDADAAAAPAQQQQLKPQHQQHKQQQAAASKQQQQRAAPVRGMPASGGSAGAGPSGTNGPAAVAAAGGAVQGSATAVRRLGSSSSTEGTSYSSDDSDDGSDNSDDSDDDSSDDDDGGARDGGAAGKRTSAVAAAAATGVAAAGRTAQQVRKQGSAQPAGAGMASTSSSNSSSDDSDDDDDDDDDSDEDDEDDEDGGAARGGQGKVPLATSNAVSTPAPAKATRDRTGACGSKSSSSDEEENEGDSSSEEHSSGSSDDVTSEEEKEKATHAPLDAAVRSDPPVQAGIASVVERRTTTIPVEYDRLPVPHGKVEVGDVLAYKLLEIGLDLCPRISEWRQSCVIAVDMVTGAAVLEPHPDPRVHPLHSELDILRARLAAEAPGEGGAAAAEAADACAVDLDWEALPFPTEYDPAGLLKVTLDRLADVRIVHAAPTAGTRAPPAARVSAPAPVPVTHSCAAVDGKPVSTPPMGTGTAAIPCFVENRQAAGGPGAAPVAKTPMRQATGVPHGAALSRPATPRPGLGTPSTSAKRLPPPPPPPPQRQLPTRPGTPAAKTSTVGATIVLARALAQGTSTEAVVAAANASKPGSVVPGVGGWAVIAEELRQKRLELGMGASTPPVSQVQVPDNSKPSREQQRKQQQQQGRIEQAQSQPSAQPHRLSGLPRPGGGGACSGAGACGAVPPSIPEVTIPGFRSRNRAHPESNGVGRSGAVDPGNEGNGCKTGVAQTEV
ncbi:hypothetical protein VaNZ11_016443, partial [Volvox africanus]